MGETQTIFVSRWEGGAGPLRGSVATHMVTLQALAGRILPFHFGGFGFLATWNIFLHSSSSIHALAEGLPPTGSGEGEVWGGVPGACPECGHAQRTSELRCYQDSDCEKQKSMGLPAAAVGIPTKVQKWFIGSSGRMGTRMEEGQDPRIGLGFSTLRLPGQVNSQEGDFWPKRV